MSPPERAVVRLRRARGGRRAVEVGIDPAQVDQALAKWRRLLGPAGPLEVNLYPARADAGAVAGHLVDQHGIGGDTTSWLADHEGLVGLVGEHDLDHTEHPDPQLGHSHPSTW